MGDCDHMHKFPMSPSRFALIYDLTRCPEMRRACANVHPFRNVILFQQSRQSTPHAKKTCRYAFFLYSCLIFFRKIILHLTERVQQSEYYIFQETHGSVTITIKSSKTVQRHCLVCYMDT